MTLYESVSFGHSGIRVSLGCCQLPAHALALSARARKTTSMCPRAIAQRFTEKLQARDVALWNRRISVCNIVLRSLIVLGLAFCIGCFISEQSGSGLKGTSSYIGLEMVNVCLWGYVLLYRRVYNKETLRRSWGYVQALEETENVPRPYSPPAIVPVIE